MENTLNQILENWNTSFAEGKKELESIDEQIELLERKKRAILPKINTFDSLFKDIAREIRNYKLNAYSINFVILPTECSYFHFAVEFCPNHNLRPNAKTLYLRFATERYNTKYGNGKVFLVDKNNKKLPMYNTTEELYNWMMTQNE